MSSSQSLLHRALASVRDTIGDAAAALDGARLADTVREGVGQLSTSGLHDAGGGVARVAGRMLRKRTRPATDAVDEDDEFVLFGQRLPWLMSHYMWPFIFSALFMSALLSGLTIARARAAQGRRPVYFHPLAVCEAITSIAAGILLWMGFWDLLDGYLVPAEWWAKLFMIAAGGFALFSTRTLYDESHITTEGKAVRYSSIGLNQFREPESPRHAVDIELQAPPEPPAPQTINRRVASERNVAESDVSASDVNEANGGEGMREEKAARYFDRPAFSPHRCGRALFAILAGLTMWVGMWDLVDQHLLPLLFEGCSVEPSLECALVKLALIAVGALGLYCTRSLYGEDGRPEYAHVNFSRIA
mmetsp:Transcript_51128/g.165136  ORF Transcript_51128/g.165136 Transcript_51128/m.165136 type:complete len:360 (+) Transcript_51128:48-1127(+)